jgi:putative copper resistance protein D
MGFAARTITGHLSENTWGAVMIALHALAAAVWCGGLAALAVTIRHRGQWARVLPRFSQVSVVCVGVLFTSGVVGALLESGSPMAWYATAHGRLLLGKAATLVALVVLGWRNRTMWVPAARAHQLTAERSQSGRG